MMCLRINCSIYPKCEHCMLRYRTWPLHVNTAYVFPVDLNYCYFNKQKVIYVTNDNNTRSVTMKSLILESRAAYNHEDQAQKC